MTHLNVLIVEDSENDAELLASEMRRGGWDIQHHRVDTAGAMSAALSARRWDIIMADYTMPLFSGPAALKLARELAIDVPFILVSGTVGAETAVSAMKAGADDYLFKGDLHRLVPVVERELRGLEERRRARTTEQLLQARAAQLAEALRLAKLGTWNLNLNTGSADLSDDACALLGRTTRGDALTVGEFLGCLHPDDRMAFNDALQNKEVTAIAAECRLLCSGAVAAVVQIRGNIVRDEQGGAVVAGGMIQDISERKVIDAELLRLKDAAEAANRAKSAFLANMSHELRTPMSAILGFAEMMSQTRPDAPSHEECIQVIRRNSHHLLELINEILDISRIEAGQMTVEQIQCDLPGLLADVIALMRPRAAEKALRLTATIDGSVPRYVRTDALKFRQILINLLGNAIKFTAAGAIEMVIRCEPQGQSVRLAVEIRDTGIGMTAEQISRLFEPFTQAEQSTTRKFGGSGLGLAISRRLARLLRGDITVASEIDIGATFTASIKAGTIDNAESVSTLEDRLSPSAVPAQPLQDVPISAQVLLVEDGRDNQRLLSTHLKMAGARVDIAENGGIAVELCRAHTYDLILMDMQMPVMDGYAATAELRRRGIKTPIIALTACAMSEDRDKCLAGGCSDYLTKPVERNLLLATIRRHLKLSTEKNIATANGHPMETSPNPQTSDVLRSSIAGLPGMPLIIRDFVLGLPREVEQLRSFVKANDLDPLRRLTHQLRGACGGYGFDAVTDIAAAAEDSIKTGQSPVVISARVNSLIQVIQRIEGYDATAILAAA